MKRILQILSVNIILFLILLLVLELSVRLFYPQILIPGTDRRLFKDSVYYNTKGLTPGMEGLSYGKLFRVDKQGFWGFNKKSHSNKKILFIGDSVTMGIGVEQDSTFAGIINNETEYDVLSPASIGLSGKDYFNIIKKITDDSTNNINAVCLFWCLNDLYNNYPDNNSPDIRSNNFMNSLFDFVKQNFKLYYLLKDSFTDRPKLYYEYDSQFYKASDSLFSDALNILLETAQSLKKKNIPLKVFLLPYEYQLRTGKHSPQNLLFDSLTAYGINVDKMRDAFGKADSDEYYLFGDGIHFSELGHRKAAEFVKNKIGR